MDHHLLPNGQRKALLDLADADDPGVTIPAVRNRDVVGLVEAGLATSTGSRYTITDAGWSWLRQAIAGGVPAQVTGAPSELAQWRRVRGAFAAVGVTLPAID
jgi:hypothetical protein